MTNNLKVLVISHNCFSNNTNVGKTISSYFDGFPSNSISQLYFHYEVPNVKTAGSYFRFSDVDAIKSIFIRGRYGTTVEPDISLSDTRMDHGNLKAIYNHGRKRTPFIYLARNFIWSLSSWNAKKLRRWVTAFNPDVIFFISGDYSFSYKIALKISKTISKPLIVSCMDDFYSFNQNEKLHFGKKVYKSFMKVVKKTIDYSSGIVCLNDKMADLYKTLFSKPTFVYYKSSETSFIGNPYESRNGFSYLGGLSLGRNLSLMDVANCIHSLNPDYYVDVYSSETDKEIIDSIRACSGIRFHGSIDANTVKLVESNTKYLIHVESQLFRKHVMYSMSTKIPESLASGACLLAYGPSDVASMEYLSNNSCAFVATNKEELANLLPTFLRDGQRQQLYLDNARRIVNKNHNKAITTNAFIKWLNEIVVKNNE